MVLFASFRGILHLRSWVYWFLAFWNASHLLSKLHDSLPPEFTRYAIGKLFLYCIFPPNSTIKCVILNAGRQSAFSIGVWKLENICGWANFACSPSHIYLSANFYLFMLCLNQSTSNFLCRYLSVSILISIYLSQGLYRSKYLQTLCMHIPVHIYP